MSIETETGKLTFDPALVGELAEKLYRHYDDAFGEYWNNAYDVDSLKVATTITPYEVTIEDWGTGIEDLNLFWRIGSPHKRELNKTPVLNRPIIGLSGIGKLSFRKIGKKVEAVTRAQNGRAYYSTVDFSVGEYFTTEYKNKKDIEGTLQHIGTKFKISDLVRNIDIKEVRDYAENSRYGIMLPGIVTERPMDIIINQKKVEVKMPKGKEASIPCRLKEKDYGFATGVLLQSKSTKLDILRRGVKIKEINPAPTHPVKGFINANWLEPTTDRHDFITDTEDYKAFHLSVRKFLIENFPSSEEIISKRKMKSIKYLASMMDDIIREIGIPKGIDIPQFKEPPKPKPEKTWKKPAEDEKEEKKPYESVPSIVISTKRAPHKPGSKPFKSKYGINWYPGNYGKDEPAILVDQFDRYVIFNMDHELMKRCDEMRSTEQRVALVPLFARGYAIIMNKQNDSMREFEKFIDDVSAKLISRIKEPL